MGRRQKELSWPVLQTLSIPRALVRRSLDKAWAYQNATGKTDMGKVIVEQIVSVDGYAAEEDGGIGFFYPGSDFSDTEPDQMRMMSTVGAIVFGATTYRMFADYWPKADATV